MPGEIVATGIEIQRAVEGLNESAHQLACAVQGFDGLARRLQRSIPAWVEEWGASNASDTQVVVTPATHQLERILGWLAIVPTGTTSATLTLGEMSVPLQNTQTLMSPVMRLLNHHDVRKLTYAPAGAGFLWLWGEQTAEAGFLDGAR